MKVNVIPHPTRDGWYYVEYRPEGYKGKRERIPVEGYEHACRRRDLIQERYDNPEKKQETHPRIEDVYSEYLTWVKANQAPDTYRSKKNAFKVHLIPHFGDFRVKELSQTVFDDFHKRLPGKRRAIIAYQHYLSGLIKWMVKRSMAPPLGFKPEEPKYRPGKPIIPSMADIQTVIDSVDAPDKKAMLHAMLWPGLRWNEARLLKWEDVYLDEGIIRVRESDQEEEVHIAIWPEQRKWLKANRKASGYIWENPKTEKPWTSLKRVLKTASAPLARKITHHDFRRRSGQNVYEASGYDIFAAQKHLRHKDIRTTMRYLGIDDQRRSKINQDVIVHVDKLRKAAKRQQKRRKKEAA